MAAKSRPLWWQSLTTMPYVDRQTWNKLGIVTRWLIAVRASVLIMTFSSAAIGGLLAVLAGGFNLWIFTLTATGLLLAHATNNLINDYVDSIRGIDTDNYHRTQYGVQVLESKLLNKTQFWRYLLVTAAAALIIGILLIAERGGITLGLMAVGAFFAIFYSWPLKYVGLGEPTVLLVWGPLMVGGTFYVVCGFWNWEVTLIACLYALGPTAVLFGKHIDKLEADKQKGVNSLPVILGEPRAKRWTITLISMQYALLVPLIAYEPAHWPLLITLINLPIFAKFIKAFNEEKPQQKPANFPEEIWPLWFSAYSFHHTRRFSMLFLLALIIEVVLL